MCSITTSPPTASLQQTGSMLSLTAFTEQLATLIQQAVKPAPTSSKHSKHQQKRVKTESGVCFLSGLPLQTGLAQSFLAGRRQRPTLLSSCLMRCLVLIILPLSECFLPFSQEVVCRVETVGGDSGWRQGHQTEGMSSWPHISFVIRETTCLHIQKFHFSQCRFFPFFFFKV